MEKRIEANNINKLENIEEIVDEKMKKVAVGNENSRDVIEKELIDPIQIPVEDLNDNVEEDKVQGADVTSFISNKFAEVGNKEDLLDQEIFQYLAGMLLITIIIRGLTITLGKIIEESVVSFTTLTSLLAPYQGKVHLITKRELNVDIYSPKALTGNNPGTKTNLLFAKAVHIIRQVFKLDDASIANNSYGSTISTHYPSIDNCNSQFNQSSGAIRRCIEHLPYIKTALSHAARALEGEGLLQGQICTTEKLLVTALQVMSNLEQDKPWDNLDRWK
jgi:hypothetical protein